MIPINFEYDPDFLKEEERNGYLVKENMKKLWLVQLDMLNEIIRICDKHNIIYWAEGGTLIGAVRHKGYVPWDDDIDILMFRKDYDKFIEVAKDELKYPYYMEPLIARGHILRIKRLDTTCCYLKNKTELNINKRFMTPKKLCVTIDIFCADNYPDGQEERDKFKQDLKELNNKYRYCKRIYLNNYHRAGVDIEKMKSYKRSLEHSLEEYDKFCQKYNDTETECIFNNAFPTLETEKGQMRYREDYAEEIYLPFEMLTLRCPKGYERVLDMHYTERTGIPWQVPTKNLGYHNQDKNIFIDIEHPFTEYTKPFFFKYGDLDDLPIKWKN